MTNEAVSAASLLELTVSTYVRGFTGQNATWKKKTCLKKYFTKTVERCFIKVRHTRHLYLPLPCTRTNTYFYNCVQLVDLQWFVLHPSLIYNLCFSGRGDIILCNFQGRKDANSLFDAKMRGKFKLAIQIWKIITIWIPELEQTRKII